MAGPIDICAFCGNGRELRESHIVPKFVFDRIRQDEDFRRMHVISADDNPKGTYAQDGPKCHLLCDGCEGFFNDSYEKNFLECWFSGSIHPSPIPEGLVQVRIPDYRKFKLFHLGVLWRAYAASLREFKQASTLFSVSSDWPVFQSARNARSSSSS